MAAGPGPMRPRRVGSAQAKWIWWKAPESASNDVLSGKWPLPLVHGCAGARDLGWPRLPREGIRPKRQETAKAGLCGRL
ncbi:hypothetical protein GCM10009642_54060 [Nocardiopsis metallicus]